MQHTCPTCGYAHTLARIVKTHITKSKGKCTGTPIEITQIKTTEQQPQSQTQINKIEPIT